MHNFKMVLTEWKIVGAEQQILATKLKNSQNAPNTSFRIKKIEI